jgi:hypothetical protein
MRRMPVIEPLPICRTRWAKVPWETPPWSAREPLSSFDIAENEKTGSRSRQTYVFGDFHEALGHTRSLGDVSINMCGFRFSVHRTKQ